MSRVVRKETLDIEAYQTKAKKQKKWRPNQKTRKNLELFLVT